MGATTENTRRIAKNTVFLTIRTIIVLLVTLYTSRIVLKNLGFEDFGLYDVIGRGIIVFCAFLRNALTNATSRYLTFELGKNGEKNISRVYSTAINTHIILALALFIIMEIIGVWFVNSHLVIAPDRLTAANMVFQFALAAFCVSIVQTPFNSNIIAHEKMDFYAMISIIEAALKLGVAYLLVVSPIDKLVSYGALLWIVSLVITMIYMLYCRHTFHDTVYDRKCWDKELAISFSKYSGWSLVVNGADSFSQQSISIFFNWFIGLTANAALGIASQINLAISKFLSTFTQAFNPQIIKSYASRDTDYFNKLVLSTSKISCFIFLFIAIPATINIDYVLQIWLGEYPEHTARFVRVIMIYYFFDSFQTPLISALHATGNLKVHQIMIGAVKLLSIPTMYFAVKYSSNGTYGLAIWAGLNGVCAAARTIYMKRLIHLDLKLYWRKVMLPVLCVGTISFPIPLLLERYLGGTIIGFLTSCIASVIICAAACYIFLNKDERRVIQRRKRVTD